MQREINEKRQELLAKEESLRWVPFAYFRSVIIRSHVRIEIWRVALLPRDLNRSSGTDPHPPTTFTTMDFCDCSYTPRRSRLPRLDPLYISTYLIIRSVASLFPLSSVVNSSIIHTHWSPDARNIGVDGFDG